MSSLPRGGYEKNWDLKRGGLLLRGGYPFVGVGMDPSRSYVVRYIKFMAKIGHPLKINQIKCFAGDIAKDNGVSRFGELGPGWTWWSKFHKRHPDIKLRTPDTLFKGIFI